MTAAQKQYLETNARFEQSCYEQAKQELQGLTCDPLTYIRKVAARAQEIKAERKA